MRIVRLLERERELAEIDDFLARALSGAGALILIEGPAGIGKTRLLGAAAERAQSMGLRVLSAHGGPLERDLPWAGVRSLFAPTVERAEVKKRRELMSGAAALSGSVLGYEAEGPGGPGSRSAALHGLYWLCANVAEQSPLLLAVDDVQWVDAPSLGFLAYLAARIEDVPVLMLACARAGDPALVAEPLASLHSQAGLVLSPAPLSQEATAQLVGDVLGEELGPGFADACLSASGGNPYLLGELAVQLRSDGIHPTRETAASVSDVTPESVRRSVLLRLARLSDRAVGLANAAATLAVGASPHQAAEIASLGQEEIAGAVDELLAAGVLAPSPRLEFVHPLIRAAVRSALGPAEAAALHERAARLLVRHTAKPEQAAAHLLETEPIGEEWAVETLLTAAARAIADGAPETAISYLRRGLDEPTGTADRIQSLRALGMAESSVGDPQSVEHLRAAHDLASDPIERAGLALYLARALVSAAQFSDACDLIEQAIAELAGRDRELELRLEAEFQEAAVVGGPTRTRALDRLKLLPRHLDGGSAAERLLIARLAMEAAIGGGTAAEAIGLARRALAGGRLVEDEAANSQVAYGAADALMLCDQFDEAAELYDETLEDARARGSAMAVALASLERSNLSYRRGEVAEAEADARQALDAIALSGWDFGTPVAVCLLINALIEQDRLSEAEDALAVRGLLGPLPEDRHSLRLLLARGQLRVARGAVREGLSDLLETGRRLEPWGLESPSAAPWRSSAAVALTMMGERSQALELAWQEVELARAFGAPRAIGIALRAAGLAEESPKQLEVLGDAVEVLKDSPARLEQARALCDLGATLRRTKRRRDARETLRSAMDLADRCGALALVRRAREELALAGARPRRERIAGPEALTGSELRIVQMAARGMTNREIAQTLFVSLRTVETHLTHAYQKLEIGSRSELAGALDQPAPV